MGLLTNPLVSQTQQPGQTAPVENNATPEQGYGANNENLPVELQQEIWNVLIGMEQEDDLPRRSEIRGIVQRRLFFRGEQYWWWNDTQALWYPPYESAPGQNATQQPTFQHVTNIFQAYCLKLSSILTQNNVQATFWPQSAKDPIDVSTAKNASKVAELVHRNNQMEAKNQDAAYFVWTDPMIATYTRFVSDAEKFGTDSEDVVESQEVEVSPAMNVCPSCGYQDPATTPEQEGFGVCPQCGDLMQQMPPETAQVPMVTGQQQIPKGQEVIDVIGSLNLRRSMWADRQEQFLYLEWVTDLHKATAKAMFPDSADAIESSGGDSSSVDGYEKLARRLLYLGYGRHTGSENINLGTLRRAWLRNRAFESCTNKENKLALQKMFPDGCYVTFFNQVYCESRNESMDSKWRCMNAMPGEGQSREAVGSCLVPINEQLNDAANLIFETAMYGVPEGFADQDAIDFEARAAQSSMPAQLSPVKLKNNQRMGDLLTWSPAVEPGRALMEYRIELMNSIPQLLCGITPAVFGGDTGSNDTLGGISIERNQALGVIGRVWRLMQEMWSQTDLLAVQCFAKHRTQDVEVAVLGEGGKFKSEWLALQDLQGKILAYPEVDQQYPVLQSQIQALFAQMLATPNEVTIALLSNPENLETVINKIGATDLTIAGEDQRLKTHNDIEDLLEGKPMPAQGAPQVGPDGQVMQAEPILVPSIVPDAIIDELPVAFKTCQEWLRSEAGQAAKTDNPEGFLNVYLYAKACQQLGKAEELQNAMAAQAVQGSGPAADMGGANDVQPPEPDGPKPAAGPAN